MQLDYKEFHICYLGSNAGLSVCPWIFSKNLHWITICQGFHIECVREKLSMCVYLVSMSQVLILNIRDTLPVGVSSPAATFHLCQRLSVHGMTLIVIPMLNKDKKKKKSIVFKNFKSSVNKNSDHKMIWNLLKNYYTVFILQNHSVGMLRPICIALFISIHQNQSRRHKKLCIMAVNRPHAVHITVT